MQKMEEKLAGLRPKFQCTICNRFLSTIPSLRRHKALVHNLKFQNETDIEAKQKKSRILCPECGSFYPRQEKLREHLVAVHGIQVEEVYLEFQTMEEFENWRYEMENSTISEYIKYTSTKVLAGGWKKTYLVCSRSFESNLVVARKRAMKNLGSKKIGKFCPSAIEVNEIDDIVYVTFWKTHYGHNSDLGHLRLHKTCREKIAGMLKEGMSFDRIIHNVKSSKFDSKKAKLLEKRDLHNIVRDYNVSYEMKPDPDDVDVGLDTENMNAIIKDEDLTIIRTSRITSKSSIERLIKKARYCVNLLEEASGTIDGEEIEEHLDKVIALAVEASSEI